MFEAFLPYLLTFVTSFITSALVTIFFLAALQRKCTKLEWSVGDLQDRVTTFKGRESAEKRWGKQAALDEAMAAAAMHPLPTARKRYDNDPLGE